MPVRFASSHRLPCVEVDIEGRRHALLLDLGADAYVVLHPDVLHALRYKRPSGISAWSDFQGNAYTSQTYVIPRLVMHGATLRDLTVEAEDPYFAEHGSIIGAPRSEAEAVREGAIGRKSLESFNWFFDLRHAAVYRVSDLELLKKEGYAVETFARVPFHLLAAGIVLDVSTNQGVKRLLLDSGASCSLMRATDEDFVDAPRTLALQLQFGEKTIDDQEFRYARLSSRLQDIDGILGADFLERCALFVDFRKRVAAIGDSIFLKYLSEQAFVRLPVRFDALSRIPLTQIRIEGTSCTVGIHLNRPSQLDLDEAFLQRLAHLRSAGTIPWKDAVGGIHDSPLFLIPEVHLGSARLRHVLVRQHPSHHSGVDGVIGHALLPAAHWLFDFGHSAICLSHQLDSLLHVMGAPEGCVSFDVSPCGLLLHFHTSSGPRQFLLVPSREHSTLNKRRPAPTVPVIPGVAFSTSDFPPLWEKIDGILGMDFLMSYFLCLDTARQVAYWAPCQQCGPKQIPNGG
jgi:predicted aspartyl protease